MNLTELKRMLWCVLVMGLLGCSAEDGLATLRKDLQALKTQLDEAKSHQSLDIALLKMELDMVRTEFASYRFEDKRKKELSARSTKASHEIHGAEMDQLTTKLKPKELKHQQDMEKEVKTVTSQTISLCKQIKTDRRMLEKSAMAMTMLQWEVQQLRMAYRTRHMQHIRLKNELKITKASLNSTIQTLKQLASPKTGQPRLSRRLRHQRTLRHRVAEIESNQNRTTEIQDTIHRDLDALNHQLSQCVKLPGWNLISTKVELLAMENQLQNEQIANVTLQMTEFKKLNSTIKNLQHHFRTFVVDMNKTAQNFVKRISRVDMSMAQVNPQLSHMRAETTKLRVSVKSVADRVSTFKGRAEMDRKLLSRVNYSVSALQRLSKQHSYRLYDFLLKAENNGSFRTENETYDPFATLPELMGEVKDLQPAQKEYLELVSRLPHECSTIDGPPGSYLIAPGGATPLDTWCDKGRTLLQRRFDGSVEFNLKYAGYVDNFGTPTGEYWLGLENMHLLTADNCSSMFISMTDIYGGGWYASYDLFYVGSAKSGYKLIVDGFTGNASDAFEYQNGMQFSAIDRDRDISNTHCAGNYEGGWWFSQCQHVNINGKYKLGLTWFDTARNEWIAVATSEMTLSRRPACVAATAGGAVTTLSATIVEPTVAPATTSSG